MTPPALGISIFKKAIFMHLIVQMIPPYFCFLHGRKSSIAKVLFIKVYVLKFHFCSLYHTNTLLNPSHVIHRVILTFVQFLSLTVFLLLLVKLSLEARKEMTGKAIKAVRHFIEKPRKRNLEEDTEEAGGSQVTYADALNHLEQSLAHLETLNHSFIISLKNSEQVMKCKLLLYAHTLG